MIRTNSKEFRNKVKQYIIEGCNKEEVNEVGEWQEVEVKTIEEAANHIWDAFMHQKGYELERDLNPPTAKIFINWCQGLPSELNTMYYYNVSAIDLLGEMLEQTEEERNEYTQEDAGLFLTIRIFNEIKKARR